MMQGDCVIALKFQIPEKRGGTKSGNPSIWRKITNSRLGDLRVSSVGRESAQ
jgi:hypothetical protein